MNNNIEDKSKVKSKTLARKPSIRAKKPPEVKQTLTSKYRMLKANPLLMNELEKAISNDQRPEKPLKILANALDNNTDVLNTASIKKNPNKDHKDITAPNINGDKADQSRNTSTRKPKFEIFSKPNPTFSQSNSTKIDFKSGHFLSSTVLESKKTDVMKKDLIKQTKPDTTNKTGASGTQKMSTIKLPKEPVRRSLSMQHLEHRRQGSNMKSQSVEDLRGTKKTDKIAELDCSTITEEGSFRTAGSTPTSHNMFKTPSAQNRKSFLFSPHSASTRKSLFLNTPMDMSKRLNDWLKRRGKSLGDYHHLKCFGIHDTKPEIVSEEDKENVIELNQTYEDLKIAPKVVTDEVAGCSRNDTKINVEVVAKEALQDLHQLILEGFPNQQCEIWLKLIKDKYKKLEEEPQYWECRAALEQSKGNISVAVECYKTAIIQGAEVKRVDQSLDQLLQKFSLLNINNDINTNQEHQERARIVKDARNIFKSSIIQFAVQERKLKKKGRDGITVEKNLTATPVRRSTRLSRSGYTSTPGIKMFSSLQEAKNCTPQPIKFQYNKALND